MIIKRAFKAVSIIIVTVTVLLIIISYSSWCHEDMVLLSASSLNNVKTVNETKSNVENKTVNVTSPSLTVSTFQSDISTLSTGTLTPTKHKDYFCCGPEELIENSNLPVRTLSDTEKAGNNIMITIRTTKKFHQKRLPILYDTWLTVVNGSNVFLVTDGEDDEYREKNKKLGINYIVVSCGHDYWRWSLCCKSGEEMALMHRPENQHYDWFCHVDDDVYVIMENLITLLSKMDPKTEARYIGKSIWKQPVSLNKRQTLLKDTSQTYYFGDGAMYCLSRPMLMKVKPWLGNGPTMAETCNMSQEPDDVTVGLTVELLANGWLTCTNLIYPHGLFLSQEKVDQRTLKQQVGFSYGCGQLCSVSAYKNNAISIPNAKFPFKDDQSRFKSLHCYLHPSSSLCNN